MGGKRERLREKALFSGRSDDNLKKLGPASWDQVDAAIEKLLREDRLKQAILDLEYLMKKSEDSFQWPLVDPDYCLALVVFRKFKDANEGEEHEG